MDVTIDLTGKDHLIRMVRAVPHIVDEELAKGVNEAVLLGEREAKRLVGVKTGHLRRSIIATPVVMVSGSASAMWGTNVPYAKAHELGTAPHIIVPRNRKALRWMQGGKPVFATKVNHPGTTGRFYMRDSKLHVRRELPKIGKRIIQRVAQRWAAGG